MKTTVTFTILLAGIASVGFFTLVPSGSFALDGQWGGEEVRAAVEVGSYEALSVEAQEKISEEKFTELVERAVQKEAVQSAVEANDYSLLSVEAQEKISEERFEKMVTKSEHKAAILAAVQNDDYAWFQAAVIAKHESKDCNKELTDEDMQEKFSELTTYYAENGELPQKKGGKKWSKWFGKGFGRGQK